MESNGHVLNGNTENGVTTLNNVVPVNLTKTDQDIVRLIGQYLKIVGLGLVYAHSFESLTKNLLKIDNLQENS